MSCSHVLHRAGPVTGMPPVLLKVLCFCSVSSSLSALEHLDWTPVSLTFSRVSEMVLHVAISALVFLQENGAAAMGMGVFTAVTVTFHCCTG